MKKISHKIRLLLAILMVAGTGLLVISVQAAGSAALTLNPSSGSYSNGSNITVTIKENSTDQINTVQADLAYDSSKLEFISINTAVSTFDYPLSATGGGGTVSIARGVSNGGTLTGTQTVAAVTFRVLVGSGSTVISFKSSSAVVRPSDGQNVWNGSTTGGTYTLTTPPPASCPAGQTGTPPNCSTPASSPTTNTTTTTTTTKPTTTTSSLSPSAAVQQANPDAPVPVAMETTGASGYLVALKVLDDNGQPVHDAEVTLDGTKKAKTDSTGIASFADILAGSHEVEVKTSSGSVRSTIDVTADKPVTDVQEFEVKLASKKSNAVGGLLGGGSALLGLIAIGFLVWRRGILKTIFKRHGTPVAAIPISTVPPQSITPANPNVENPTVVYPAQDPTNSTNRLNENDQTPKES